MSEIVAAGVTKRVSRKSAKLSPPKVDAVRDVEAKAAAPVVVAPETPKAVVKRGARIKPKPAAETVAAPVVEPAKPVADPAAEVVEPIEAAAKPVAKAAVRATKPVSAIAAKVIDPAPRVAATPAVVAAIETAPAQIAEGIEAAMSPAVLSDTIQIERETLAPIAEGTEKMATVTTGNTAFASEKLQSLFGDVGARFKAGFEKSTKMSEEMVELAKGNVEAVVASARVAAKGSETLGQDAAEYSKKSFESAVAAMKSFASVKSPTELFQLQSDFAKTSFDSAVAEASKFSESMMKLAGEVAQPLSSRYAVAAEKIKAVTL